MARKRRYHPEFVADLKPAIDYYDGISASVGNRFRDSIRQRIEDVTDRPESFAPIANQVRAALLPGFPFVLLFEVHSQFVGILRIVHAASDTVGWFDRKFE
jgi:plasmid stabilization system protein ParE